MRKTREINWVRRMMTVVTTLALVLMLGLLADRFSIVSNAQSQGKVTATSAKIRKEANTSSESLAGVFQNDILTINNQVTGSDGMIWYQVIVNADTLGYIRSDLISITDGTTPPTASGTTTAPASDTPATTPPATEEQPVQVTAVEPLSATVKGGDNVRVRSNASTSAATQIITTVKSGLAITVTGTATGTDGNLWYQVNFISNGTEITGFIHSDYVSLSGEPVPVTNGDTEPAGEEPTAPEEMPAPVVMKDWDTQYDSGKWVLIDYVNDNAVYDIKQLMDVAQNNQSVYDAEHAKVKSQKVVIIILVILLIVAVGAVTMLIFKIKDMMDSAYFAEVERETIRRRTADRPQGSGQKVMHTVGADKKQPGARPAGASAQGGTRPAGARPAGAPTQGGARPAGTRPAGAPTQGGARPAGARPAGAPAQGGARPAGTRPAGAPAQGGTRPAGAPTQGGTRSSAVPNGARQGVRQTTSSGPQQGGNAQNSAWKSKNFMEDEDEFEFEFLNWDGNDDQ